MYSTKSTKTAGFIYLAVIGFGVFSQLVRTNLISYEDALLTSQQIEASELLFRLSFVSDFIMIVSYLLLAANLYWLFKVDNKELSMLFVLFTVVSTAIMSMNMLNQFVTIHLLGGASYLDGLDKEVLQVPILFFLQLHKYGYLIAQVFFGLWLLPLGYLIVKSARFPKVLGWLLIIACFGHLIEFLISFLCPSYQVLTYPGLLMATIGEFSFCYWLLFKGQKEQV